MGGWGGGILSSKKHKAELIDPKKVTLPDDEIDPSFESVLLFLSLLFSFFSLKVSSYLSQNCSS